MAKQTAHWPRFYGSLRVNVFAPELYFPERVKTDDEYSNQIRRGKHSDNSAFFFPKLSKLFEQVLAEFKPNLITAIPKHDADTCSVTMLKLAEKLSNKSGIPTEKLIKRKKATKKLTECATAEERYAAIQDTLGLSRPLKGEKCILLLDDTRTTGMTLLECAKILKKGGATDVVALCLGINETRKGHV